MNKILNLVIVIMIIGFSANCKTNTTGGSGGIETIAIDTDIVYYKAPEKDLMLDIYWHDNTDENFPLIVWIHGGAWRAGGKKGGGKRTAEHFLDKGFNVASVSYRLSQDAIWPAQIIDCKAAIRWLRANSDKYNIDADKIGVWGSSAGGHLVAMLGTSSEIVEWDQHGDHQEVSGKVQAVCDFYGPTNFLRMNDEPGNMDHDAADSPESMLIGAPIQENPELVQKANPITYVSGNEPPFLIVHGDSDPLVLHSQSVYLEAALKEKGIEVELITIEEGGHGGPGFREQNDKVEAFFNKNLK